MFMNGRHAFEELEKSRKPTNKPAGPGHNETTAGEGDRTRHREREGRRGERVAEPAA